MWWHVDVGIDPREQRRGLKKRANSLDGTASNKSGDAIMTKQPSGLSQKTDAHQCDLDAITALRVRKHLSGDMGEIEEEEELEDGGASDVDQVEVPFPPKKRRKTA